MSDPRYILVNGGGAVIAGSNDEPYFGALAPDEAIYVRHSEDAEKQLAAVATLAEALGAELLQARKQLRRALNMIDRLCRQNVKLKTENAIRAIAMAAADVSVSSCSGVRSRRAGTSARTTPSPTVHAAGEGAARSARAAEPARRSGAKVRSVKKVGAQKCRAERKRHAARKGAGVMPIRPENKKRYPKDWPAISQRIRSRAGNVCERCKAPNDTVIFRGEGVYVLPNGETRDDVTGEYLTMTRGSELPPGRFVRVVLTVAHLDHTPENCADENLQALCQACHNRYDAPMRAAGRKERREDASPQTKLFGGAS